MQTMLVLLFINFVVPKKKHRNHSLLSFSFLQYLNFFAPSFSLSLLSCIYKLHPFHVLSHPVFLKITTFSAIKKRRANGHHFPGIRRWSCYSFHQFLRFKEIAFAFHSQIPLGLVSFHFL